MSLRNQPITGVPVAVFLAWVLAITPIARAQSPSTRVNSAPIERLYVRTEITRPAERIMIRADLGTLLPKQLYRIHLTIFNPLPEAIHIQSLEVADDAIQASVSTQIIEARSAAVIRFDGVTAERGTGNPSWTMELDTATGRIPIACSYTLAGSIAFARQKFYWSERVEEAKNRFLVPLVLDASIDRADLVVELKDDLTSLRGALIQNADGDFVEIRYPPDGDPSQVLQGRIICRSNRLPDVATTSLVVSHTPPLVIYPDDGAAMVFSDAGNGEWVSKAEVILRDLPGVPAGTDPRVMAVVLVGDQQTNISFTRYSPNGYRGIVTISADRWATIRLGQAAPRLEWIVALGDSVHVATTPIEFKSKP